MPGGKEINQSLVYGCMDNVIFWDRLNPDDVTLERLGILTLPTKLQFLARSRDGHFFYAVISDAGSGVNGASGSLHGLQAIAVSAEDGSLSLAGPLYPLPERPIHISIDDERHYASVAFNKSGQIRIYHLADDGTILGEVPQDTVLYAGIFSHQSVFLPDGRHILVVSRGNAPKDGKAEELGSLTVYAFDGRSGRASLLTRVDMPAGIGPRHVIFHPEKDIAYLLVERGSYLFTYEIKDGLLGKAPISQVETLEDRSNQDVPRQRGGVGVIHPSGRYLYVSNRADKTEAREGREYLIGGENNLAIYALDEATGKPDLLGHIDCYGAEARNLAIDPSGQVLISANQKTMMVPDGTSWKEEPTNMALFRIGEDGQLTFVRRYDMRSQGRWLFWLGIFPA